MNSSLKLTTKEKYYIGGFLDGDGSIFAQIIYDENSRYKFKIRISIGFYQKKSNHWFILKLKKILKHGYIRIRKDEISEYVITSSNAVEQVLLVIKESVMIKKRNVKLGLQIIKEKRNINSPEKFIEVCRLVDKLAKLNHSKNRKITTETVLEALNK